MKPAPPDDPPAPLPVIPPDGPRSETRRAGADPAAHPWRAGLHAARANLGPGLVLSAFAAGLAAAYFAVPAVRAGLDRVGDWKLAGGFAFSIVSTGLFGGTLPWLINRLRPRRPGVGVTPPPVSHLVFLTAFWAYKGIEVDGFYRVQSWLWGDASGPAVVAGKVLLDLGVWCAVWAVPTTALGYAFMEGGFTRTGLRRWMSPGWLRRKIAPIVVSNFFVWAPACAAIYCMPPALQVPVQNLVLCFWSLILILQVRGGTPEPSRV